MALGLIHIYTGDGKGKTTTAVGLGVRAFGCGYRVMLVQFLKNASSGELSTLAQLGDGFKVVRFDKPDGFIWQMNEEEKLALKKSVSEGFQFVREVMAKNACDLLILDEMIGTVTNRLVEEEEVLSMLQNKPSQMEIVMTGRKAPQKLMQVAHYVTEMLPLKHPMEKGIGARRGIEF